MKSYSFRVAVKGSTGNLLGIYDSASSLITHQKKTTVTAGFVTDGQGNPLAGVTVELLDSNDISLGIFAIADENGFYYFLDTDASGYTIQIEISGQVYSQVVYVTANELNQVDFEII